MPASDAGEAPGTPADGAPGTSVPAAGLIAAGMLAWALASLPWWRRAWPFTIDDAYISARYAQQWVAGHGLVYSIGERVEGFSNFTWVCLLAVLERIGVPFENGVKILGLCAGAAAAGGALALLVRPLRVRTLGWAVLAGLWLGLDPGFAVWTVAGLETPLFTALLVWALILWLDVVGSSRGGAIALFVVLALLAWTRPEGPAVAVGLLLLTPVCFREPGPQRRRVLACCGALAVVAAGFGLRRWYYGVWWPNPYYVKLGGGVAQVAEGLGYWGAAVVRRGGPFLLGWVALALVRPGTDARVARTQRVLVLVLLGYSLFIIRSGREPFPFHRFWMPLAPLAIVVGMPSAARLRGTAARPWVAVTVGACLVATPLASAPHWRQVATLTRVTRDISLPFGRWVRETHAELPSSLAVFWAGAMPYAAGPAVRALDMGGLCDAHIGRRALPWAERNHGHTKHDFAYVLAAQPTYVTDDALHTLDALIALGGPRAQEYAAQKAAFLAAYTRLNDHLFVRIQADTLARFDRFTAAFPDDVPALRARALYEEYGAGATALWPSG